ncbi:hypothetical protein NQZ68_014937, partial [Dissostichus eleginoides]
FPMGPGPDGPMGGMGAMEQHHMNGSLGSGDMDGLPKNSPNNMAGMNNPPGTPRDDGEMAGNFLNPFQSESASKQQEGSLLRFFFACRASTRALGQKEPESAPSLSLPKPKNLPSWVVITIKHDAPLYHHDSIISR